MLPVISIILAAGEGKRMKSALPKVLHEICGLPMAEWVRRACAFAQNGTLMVVGNGADEVKARITCTDFALQPQQLGTCHAVLCAREKLEKLDGYALVLAGDMPLLKEETLRALADAAEGHAAALLTSELDDPTGYGRIVREGGRVKAIVEQRDATAEQLAICEVNVSAYCFKLRSLLDCLKKVGTSNAQGEYYITDCIAMLKDVVALKAPAEECMGVNDRIQLAECAAIMRRRINRAHMLSGVTLIDPETTYIGADVTIGADTLIYPGNVLEGSTSIGCGVTLYPNCRIIDSAVGDGAHIGPLVHLRPNARVGKNCRVGNFVEIKNSSVDDGSKVSHLTYVGDSDIGKDCNVGCGVVFVNYDGIKKHRSKVGDNVFIGCNTNLISPVNVGNGAYIAAGSTITDDVPDGALAIARERQTNKPGRAAQHLKKR